MRMNTNTEVEILIVDNEKDLCFLLKSMLSKLLSAKIDVCYSTKEAKKLLEQKPYDIAFFDYQLGDGTGLELVEYIQINLKNPPYIVTMSANVSQEEIRKWKNKGPNILSRSRFRKKKLIRAWSYFGYNYFYFTVKLNK